jgi:hypothetical protein
VAVVLTELERAVARASAARDRQVRGQRDWPRTGIVHTPLELARYAAQALDAALRRMDMEHGLADPRVALVDPACGPGAFLAAVLAQAKGPGPRWLVGLDSDPRALEAARGLLAAEAAQRGWRLRLERCDALTRESPWPAALAPGMVAVVLGNPPWRAAHAPTSSVTDAWMKDFLEDGEGRRLAERRLGVLQDAYVQFWRWAAEVARRGPAGGAVLFVTNGSFLEGPVHRGMRRALLEWFDGMDVLDLGGSGLVARQGRSDANVFGVRPQVAVTLAWRGGSPGRVTYGRLWGSRADKLARLMDRGRSAAPQLALHPKPPAFVFVPCAGDAWPEEAVSLVDLMPFHREGIQSNRDAVATDVDRDRLLVRLRAFASGRAGPELEPALRAARHYDPERAREAVRRAFVDDPDGLAGRSVRPVAYRPFEPRWFAPVAPLCHRPRPALLRAVDASAMVLLTVRKDRGDRPWAHFGVVRHVPDNCWLSTRSSCRTRAFPSHDPEGRPNVGAEVLRSWEQRLGTTLAARDVLPYALATLASPGYRERFGGELRLDYPRLLPPPDVQAWEAMVGAGEALCRAFLDRPARVDSPTMVVGHAEVPVPRALERAVACAQKAFEGLTPRVPRRRRAPRRAGR